MVPSVDSKYDLEGGPGTQAQVRLRRKNFDDKIKAEKQIVRVINVALGLPENDTLSPEIAEEVDKKEQETGGVGTEVKEALAELNKSREVEGIIEKNIKRIIAKEIGTPEAINIMMLNLKGIKPISNEEEFVITVEEILRNLAEKMSAVQTEIKTKIAKIEEKDRQKLSAEERKVIIGEEPVSRIKEMVEETVKQIAKEVK